ncbi:MAG: CDP-alcohol phosphatidyltransferase family protein [Chryseolinea sp.]
MDNKSNSRRPIASRDSAWAKRLAAYLAQKNVSPNFVSILSIAFAALAFAAFYLDPVLPQYHIVWMILAIAGIQLRLVMNLLDGMVAVEHNKKSAVGGLFNEVPDRIADTLIICGVYYEIRLLDYAIPLVYWAVILSITTAYIRTLGASLQCGHHFLGPMAKQHRMALLIVACVIGIFYPPVFYYAMIIMNIGLVLTCYRRLVTVAAVLKAPSKP